MLDPKRYPELTKRIQGTPEPTRVEKIGNTEYPYIAELVRSYRLAARVSQLSIGIELGYKNQQFISNVERGQCSVPLKVAPQLARILHIPKEKIYHAFIMDNIIKYERAFNEC